MRHQTFRTRRWGVMLLAASTILAASCTLAAAQEKTPFPEYTGGGFT